MIVVVDVVASSAYIQVSLEEDMYSENLEYKYTCNKDI